MAAENPASDTERRVSVRSPNPRLSLSVTLSMGIA
jgi:hypothetical protein